MSKRAEEACIAYSIAAKEVRELTKKIYPGECTRLVTCDVLPWSVRPDDTVVPCISKLFSVTHESDGCGGDMYQEKSDEIECEMCERCLESLKAVRDRKVARKRLGAAKRSVDAIGKRLNREDTLRQTYAAEVVAEVVA